MILSINQTIVLVVTFLCIALIIYRNYKILLKSNRYTVIAINKKTYYVNYNYNRTNVSLTIYNTFLGIPFRISEEFTLPNTKNLSSVITEMCIRNKIKFLYYNPYYR